MNRRPRPVSPPPPDPDPDKEFIPTERIALVVYLMCKGRRFHASEVAELVGITRHGARAMLKKMTRKIPLRGPEEGEAGEWYIPDDEDIWWIE